MYVVPATSAIFPLDFQDNGATRGKKKEMRKRSAFATHFEYTYSVHVRILYVPIRVGVQSFLLLGIRVVHLRALAGPDSP